jgi:hypothetical protein
VAPIRRYGAALLGLLPVAPVLAWPAGLGSFRGWFLAVTVPALVALVAVAATMRDLRPMLSAGAVGGLLGTIGYDVFRVPFAVAGVRLFAPIDSYGVLLLGADTSSSLSGFAGWTYHLSNGVGFGIAYALVAYGRSRWWAVGWAMVLETATVVTPFASVYGLRGRWDLIAVAYAAHVCYGLPLGVVVERRVVAPAVRLLGVAVIGLAVWLRPWPPDGGPNVTVRDGVFHAEWVRVARGGCATFENTDAVAYRIGDRQVEPGTVTEVCFTDPGVHRVRLTGEPYSGGFVIVER